MPGQWVYVDRAPEPEGPSEVYSLRLPSEALERLRALAGARGLKHTAVARDWLLDRLEAEEIVARQGLAAAESAPAYRAQRTEPLEWVRARLGDTDQLCRRFGVARLGIFGSAARGDFDPSRSDVDVAVEFEDGSPSERADRYFGLIDELERLTGRAIDLVELPAVGNPLMRAAIERTLVMLYERA